MTSGGILDVGNVDLWHQGHGGATDRCSLRSLLQQHLQGGLIPSVGSLLSFFWQDFARGVCGVCVQGGRGFLTGLRALSREASNFGRWLIE